jgi:hypothetical protein
VNFVDWYTHRLYVGEVGAEIIHEVTNGVCRAYSLVSRSFNETVKITDLKEE